MSVTIHINDSAVLSKVQNDDMGLLIAHNWKRLIDPYTPRDTGRLMNNTDILPWKIHYKTEYAAIDYFNTRGVIFKTVGTGRNPYATDHWDVKAANAGQLNKLYQIINAALRRG